MKKLLIFIAILSIFQIAFSQKLLEQKSNYKFPSIKKEVSLDYKNQRITKGSFDRIFNYAFMVKEVVGDNQNIIHISPLFPDTTIAYEFQDSYGNPDYGTPFIHAISTILDPAADYFIQPSEYNIGRNDDYYLHGLSFYGIYNRNLDSVSYNDTLITPDSTLNINVAIVDTSLNPDDTNYYILDEYMGDSAMSLIDTTIIPDSIFTVYYDSVVYSIDSVYSHFDNRIPLVLKREIVDTLLVEIDLNIQTTRIRTAYFVGMETEFNTDTVYINALTYNINNDNLIADSVITIKVPLTGETFKDSSLLPSSNNFYCHKIDVPLPKAFKIEAKHLITSTFRFIPGYEWVKNQDTASNLNYINLLAFEENGPDTYPYYSYDNYNESGVVNKYNKFDPSDSYYGYYINTYAFENTYSYENFIIDYNLAASKNIGINETNNNLSVKNYPNPFENTTNIRYDLGYTDNVVISISDITGKVVYNKDLGKQSGENKVQINANDWGSGVYFYTLTTSRERITNKMIVK